MNCNKVQELIEQEKLENLPEQQRLQAEGHLRSCPACQEFMQQENILRATFKDFCQVTCPENVADQIFASIRINQPATQKSWVDLLWGYFQLILPRPALAAWLILMMFIGGAYFISNNAVKRKQEYDNLVEIRQKKAQIDYAFSLLFRALRKSEEVTRDEIIEEKIIQPARKSLQYIINPTKPKGEI